VAACTQFEDLIRLEAAGGVDASERQKLEEHLVGCTGCTAEATASGEVVALLAFALGPVVPSDLARRRLLNRIRAKPAGASRTWLIAAMATLVAAAFAGLWLRDRGELSRVKDELAQREAFYRDELLRQEKKYAVLRSPNLRTVDLRGQSQGGAHLDARAFVDKDKHTWVVLSYQLPKLPPDKDYELWFFNGDKPVRAGILSQDPSEPTRIEVPENLPQITATAVTIEPKGGLAAPSGPVVMKGDL
jgi:hypothetical protein